MKSLPDSAIKEDTYTAAETIIDEYKSKRDNILKSIKNTVRTSYKHLPRWQNEFRFFYYIKLLHPDAIYQYTSEGSVISHLMCSFQSLTWLWNIKENSITWQSPFLVVMKSIKKI